MNEAPNPTEWITLLDAMARLGYTDRSSVEGLVRHGTVRTMTVPSQPTGRGAGQGRPRTRYVHAGDIERHRLRRIKRFNKVRSLILAGAPGEAAEA